MKHTPGPWQINNGQRGAFYITAENDTAIASTYEPTQAMRALTGAANPEANARLIAAAPDMLTALRDLADVSRSYLQHMDAEDVEALEAARAAIAKATGAQS